MRDGANGGRGTGSRGLALYVGMGSATYGTTYRHRRRQWSPTLAFVAQDDSPLPGSAWCVVWVWSRSGSRPPGPSMWWARNVDRGSGTTTPRLYIQKCNPACIIHRGARSCSRKKNSLDCSVIVPDCLGSLQRCYTCPSHAHSVLPATPPPCTCRAPRWCI